MFDELRYLFLSAFYHQESEQTLVKRWNEEISRLQDVFDRLTDKVSVPQLRPVVHGKWILHDNGSATCSVCKCWQKLIYDDDSYQHYCGNCGAQMEVEE